MRTPGWTWSRFEDSAAPFHDWNERITRECYAPNTRARAARRRRPDHQSAQQLRLDQLQLRPHALLSGWPTTSPETLQGIVEADRLSRTGAGRSWQRAGQAYNHIILPLASPRDKKTQVRWGIADFRHRFGRDPEGMWLAETAVDVESLEVLAEAGIRFTILAPRQAQAVAEAGREELDGDSATASTRRAPTCAASPPGDRSSCSSTTASSPAGRLRAAARQRRAVPGAALPGVRRPPRRMPSSCTSPPTANRMAITMPTATWPWPTCLTAGAHDPDVRLTNYGEFLELHPPEWEVEIHDNSSWSCVHGVERWRSDCGCKIRGDWQQKWRAAPPERARHAQGPVSIISSARADASRFPNPWVARDAYIDVILDRRTRLGPDRVSFASTATPTWTPFRSSDALRLLEMQQDAMLMFTICGWFFDEISGLETIQCLQYAARAIHWPGISIATSSRVRRGLAEAPSNMARSGNGGVWDQLIRPADGRPRPRAGAPCHQPDLPPADEEIPARSIAFDLECWTRNRSRGSGHLAVGRLRVRSRRT